MNCLDNNNFITQDSCGYTNNSNLDIYYNPIINYCNLNDNITSSVCKDFYSSDNKIQLYYQQKINSSLNSDYLIWDKKWKELGCFSDLPINIYNKLVILNNDIEKLNLITNLSRSTALSDRNICYTGEAIENSIKFNINTCIYSQNKKFKLCQTSNGDLVLYNIEKNKYKILNSNKIANINSSLLPYLIVQPVGNIVNYNNNNQMFWTSNTSELPNAKDKGIFLVLRNDGKVVIYNKDGKIINELNFIEPFENPENIEMNCHTPMDLINNINCSNEYVESYKVYLKDMNKYCNKKNNIIDSKLCDELFMNEYNLNDYDTLIDKKKDRCLDLNNYLNDKCIYFNNKYPEQLKNQFNYCKYKPNNSTCKELYTKYKEINADNEFVKSTNHMLLIIFIILISIISSSGIYFILLRKKNKINSNIKK